MRHRTLDEMVSYFNQQVSEMDIDQSYKIQLLGMISAIAYGVQKPQWIPCNKCKHYEGVHEVQGHAPCAFWGIGAVMWHDACKRAEPWRGEEHGFQKTL